MPKEVAHHVHESPAVMTLPLDRARDPHGGGGPRGRHPLVAGHRVRALPRPGARRSHEAEHSAGVAFSLLVLSAPRGHRGRRAGLDGLRPHARCGPPPSGWRATRCTRCCSRSTTWTRSTTRSSCGRSTALSLVAGARLRPRPDRRHRQRGGGALVTGWARGLRRVQTGFVMNYALGHAAGRGRRGRLPARAPLARHGVPPHARHLPPDGRGGRSSLLLPRRPGARHQAGHAAVTTLVTFVVSLPRVLPVRRDLGGLPVRGAAGVDAARSACPTTSGSTASACCWCC